jgi:hypothetical protein
MWGWLRARRARQTALDIAYKAAARRVVDEARAAALPELHGLRWMPCSSTACAHLETTHRRVMATELWACTGCNNTRTAPVKEAH